MNTTEHKQLLCVWFIVFTLGASELISQKYIIGGQKIKVVADNMLPYVTSRNGSDELGGYLGEMWSVLQEELQFESVVIPSEYTKGIEILASGRADVMLAAVVANKNVRDVVYSQPYFYNWYHLYTKQPEARASSSSYLKTLSPELWAASLALFAVMTAALWLTTKLLGCVEPYFSIPSCCRAVLGGFINQALDMKVRSYSARMQLTIALIFGFLLYCAITAVLVSNLANLDVSLPFNTISEIRERRTHSLCVRTNSFVYNNFTDSNKIILPEWRGIVNGPGCLDTNWQANVAKILCSKGVVVLENRIVMGQVVKNYNVSCKIAFLSSKYFATGNFFLFSKTFKYRNVINKTIKKMRSAGVLQRIEDYWVQKLKTDAETVNNVPQVTIFHIQGMLVLYVTALFLSFLVLGFEKLFRYYFTISPEDHFIYVN